MKKKITVLDTNANANNFIGLIKIWNIIKSYDQILKEEQSIDLKDFLPGYVYFIEVWLRAFLNEIQICRYVPLKSNYELYRADHVGVHISKISNSCEKIIFIRNYYKLIKGLGKCQNEKSINIDEKKLQATIAKFDNFIKIFESQLNRSIHSDDELPLEKNDRVLLCTISTGLVSFNHFNHRPVPGTRIFPLFTDKFTEKEIQDNFQDYFLGYKTTLLHMWKQCLNKNQFEIVKGIKDTIGWTIDYLVPKYAEKFEISKDSATVDSFFIKIIDDILEPLKEEKNTDVILDVYFLFNRNMSLDNFSCFLEDIAPPRLNENDIINELFYGILLK